MSAQPSRRTFSPEERAGYLGWKFGGTLDWCSLILCERDYPIAELRWFVDAVQGLCKGREMRIAHSTLAKRAGRFKNKLQARDLARHAIDADREWSRLTRCMIFDIERPKPGEMEGKDKRARTRYTDYLTPAAVWAQEVEHKVKKSDEVRWKRDGKYRMEKRQEIMAEALKMLPQFERVEDMPPSTKPTDSRPLSLSEYIQQREKILLAENRRILDRVSAGDPVTAEDIDKRLAALDIFHERAICELEESYRSTRDVLLGLRKTRLTRAMDFTDIEEIMDPVDEILAQQDKADVTPTWLEEALQESDRRRHKGGFQPPPSTSTLNGNKSFKGCSPALEPAPHKGGLEPPLVRVPAEEVSDELEEVVIGEAAEEAAATAPLANLDYALRYAALGWPVFPTKPDKKPYAPHGFKDAARDEKKIRAFWAKWPDAGIGIPTGKASGLLVLDIDPDKGGDASLSALVEQHGDLPPTAQAKTPSAGAHHIFNYPAHVEVRNSVSKIGKGIDIRGEGGYFVAPGCDPSREWVNPLGPADAPAWLIEAATSEKHQSVNTDRKLIVYPSDGGRYFGEGERNKGLRDVACGRWIHGYAENAQDLYEQLRGVRDTRCALGKDSPATDAQLWNMAHRTSRKYDRGELRKGGTA
jgi:hypothetical protein